MNLSFPNHTLYIVKHKSSVKSDSILYQINWRLVIEKLGVIVQTLAYVLKIAPISGIFILEVYLIK